jgi:DNA topoisomerase-2
MINDGDGIDVALHPEYNIYIPELIFGHLRTSTNYNKQEKKIVGGKNGFGVKLVFIWSSWGKIETVDHTRGLKYVQEFSDNLNVIHKPKITKSAVKPYTTITFKPDYKRLGIDSLSSDMISLFKRRVYDIAAITSKKIKVKYNDELIPVKNFQNYVDMYIGTKNADKSIERIYEEANERWEYAACIAPKEEFTQVSFVNGIFTGKGGKHVDYILNQIVRKLTAYISKKKKVDVNPSTIKEQLMLFVRCDIDNPSFDSQTKDYMTTPISSFGSSCEVSEKFIEKLAKMGVMDAACALTEVKEIKAAKKTDGTKSKRIRGIPKLMDANFAGTEKSHECSIILCEGDSAKAGIVSGLTKDDRNIIGVYPMRGKLFNVRGETKTRIFENKEINEIKQILGLETGKKYTQETAREKLRYGKVIFMTDQDLDGSHIKGLGINLFDSEWETLINIPGFIGFMNTPILKARKGSQELAFYNDGEYEEWKSKNGGSDSAAVKGWKIKYYKGLGTSTGKEFKEYFENKKIVSFVSTGETTRDAIDMVFNKKRASDRKTWLEAYDRKNYLDTGKEQVTYEEFIGKEMIHFSKYDCERSIPNLMDGLKTSQRKILFTAFKRNLNAEIKVAQFSGSVSELSCYHHGEQSINGAIVNMAQNFVGSNNINLLEPKGQFGTRLRGGEDSASERYIFTHLSKIARSIFPQADDSVLTYLDDDGTQVEPIYYAPVIPMILVNGSKGIGTGFSTDIMCYDPVSIIDELCVRLKGGQTDFSNIAPYYEGFKGTITALNETKTKYLVKGCYEVISAKQVRITELPVGTWTDDYKEYLEDLISGDKEKEKEKEKGGKKKENVVRDYNDMSTDKIVDITVTFAVGAIDALVNDTKGCEQGCNGLEKLLKLYTTKTTTNMHMFDEKEKLCHFKSVAEVVEHFMGVRLEGYVVRKAKQIKELTREMEVLKNKARFITEVLDSTIDMRGKKREQVSEMLTKADYKKFEDDEDYKYLVKMPMDMVTSENVEHLNEEKEKKVAELNKLQSTSEKQIWISELEELKEQYNDYKKERNAVGVVAKKVVKKFKIVSSKASA